MNIGHIVGHREVFAIEWCITEALESVSQIALGYFVVHINGKSFGVKSPDATLLGCSLYEVKERIAKRGAHVATFSKKPAIEIADAYRNAIYSDLPLNAKLFELSVEEFTEIIFVQKIQWAPDGDAAFDDGGHILHFDDGLNVRLVAFSNEIKREDFLNSVVDINLDAANFYGTLEKWVVEFDVEREIALKN
jgi:hypothetical protein